MRTACFDAVSAIPQRIGELELLVREARDRQPNDEALYNALCRACSVLMSSQLEGFLKDLSSALVGDFNFYEPEFRDRPKAMQRDFCLRIASYEGVPQKEIDKRVEQLISFFSDNSVPLNMHSFPYKESSNKNPGAEVIDIALAKLGIPNAVSSISGGFFRRYFRE